MKVHWCFGYVWLRSPNYNNSNNASDVNKGNVNDNNNVNNPINGAVPDLLLSKEKSQRVYVGTCIVYLEAKESFPFLSHICGEKKTNHW